MDNKEHIENVSELIFSKTFDKMHHNINKTVDKNISESAQITPINKVWNIMEFGEITGARDNLKGEFNA